MVPSKLSTADGQGVPQLPPSSPSYCRHWRRRPSNDVYVPDNGSKERNCVQPGGPIVSLRGSSSARLGGTAMAPTRSTVSGLSVAGGPPSDRFAAAGPSSVGVRFSCPRTDFSSGVEGLISAAGGLSSAPTLFDGSAISPRDVLSLSSAVARLST